jgi:hypothetical protein
MLLAVRLARLAGIPNQITESLMEKFENTVSTLLEAEGFWVRRAFKVNVTLEEKRQVGKQSSPRPEIDMLAFHLGRNEVLALDVKAFLDSPGVKLAHLLEEHEVPAGRHKLFTSERYRTIVLARLLQDLIAAGMANAQTQVRLGMVVGKVNQGQSEAIRELIEAKGWLFWSPDDIKQKVVARTERANDPAPRAAALAALAATDAAAVSDADAEGAIAPPAPTPEA